MKLIGRSQMVSHYSYEESIERLIELGYEGVEISIVNKEFKIRNEFFQEETIEQIKGSIEKHSECRFSISVHKDYVNNDVVFQAILDTIPITSSLNIDTLIINGAPSKSKTEEEAIAEWELMLERTKEIVNKAEQYKVKIAVEYEPNFIVGNTSGLHRLFKSIDSNYLGANLDIGHVFLCDDEPLQAVKSLKGKVFHVHIEDMKTDVHNHLIPGHGDMDLKLYIETLKDIGFNGLMGVDLYSYDYESVSEQSIQYLAKLI